MDTRLINNSAIFQIKSDIKADKLTHAYLFISDDGELNKEVTKYVAKMIMCNNKPKFEPCGVCPACTKIDRNIHSDVRFYGNDKKIMVDDVKAFLETLNVMPYESDKKVYIFNGLEDMNEASQNKILKSIEEPPKDTFILLSTTNEYKVLETIKSRTKRIYVPSLTIDELKQELDSRDIPNSEMIAIEACGNLSVAEVIINSKAGSDSIYKTVESIYSDLKKTSQITDYFAKLSLNSKFLPYIFDLITLFARDMIFLMSGADEYIYNKHKKFDLIKFSDGFTIDALTRIIEITTECKKRLSLSVSLDTIINYFLLNFLEVRIKCKKQ